MRHRHRCECGCAGPGCAERLLGHLDDRQTAVKRKELADLLAMLDLAAIDGTVIDRAWSSFAINVRAPAPVPSEGERPDRRT